MNYFGYEEHKNGDQVMFRGSGIMTSTSPFPYMVEASEHIKSTGARDVLVLGYGLGYGPACIQECTGADITAVDINEYIVNHPDSAHKKLDWFNPEIIIADAREFIIETAREWDACVVDIFTGSMQVPEFVVSEAFAEKLDRIISGVVYYNTYGHDRERAKDLFTSLGRQCLPSWGRPSFFRA